MHYVPQECGCRILFYTDLQTLGRCLSVCKQWQKLASDAAVWNAVMKFDPLTLEGYKELVERTNISPPLLYREYFIHRIISDGNLDDVAQLCIDLALRLLALANRGKYPKETLLFFINTKGEPHKGILTEKRKELNQQKGATIFRGVNPNFDRYVEYILVKPPRRETVFQKLNMIAFSDMRNAAVVVTGLFTFLNYFSNISGACPLINYWGGSAVCYVLPYSPYLLAISVIARALLPPMSMGGNVLRKQYQ